MRRSSPHLRRAASEGAGFGPSFCSSEGSLSFPSCSELGPTVHEPPLAYVFYGMPGTFLWGALGVGMAAASVALEGREDQSRTARLIAGHPWSCWLAGLAIYVALSSVYPPPTLALLKPDGLQIGLEFVGVAASAALFMLPAVFGRGFGGLPRRILTNPVLSWLGVISYGVYLYPVPIQVEFLELRVSPPPGQPLR